MARFASSGGVVRAMRSYKSYLLIVLFLYLLIVLVFHAQLRVYDGTETVARSKKSEPEPAEVDGNRSTAKTISARVTKARKMDSTVSKAKPSRSEDNDRAFPLVTNCFQASSDEFGFGQREISFQKIGDDFLYSAYYDDRIINEKPLIRVIALLKKSADHTFHCHIPYANAHPHGKQRGQLERKHFDNELNGTSERLAGDSGIRNNGGKSNEFHGVGRDETTKSYRWKKPDPLVGYYTVRASVYEMCENHNKDYGGWILSCRLARHVRQLSCNVLVTKGASRAERNTTVVSIPVFRVTSSVSEVTRRKYAFGICVPPLFGHIPSTTLVEFVEFSRILGANHLIFYHRQVSREIAKALSYYRARGVVTTIRWDIPIDDKAVWYHGQLLAINDCLYRSMHAFQHVAFNDIDEFIVPHIQLTWKEMVSSLRRGAAPAEQPTVAVPPSEEQHSSHSPFFRDSTSPGRGASIAGRRRGAQFSERSPDPGTQLPAEQLFRNSSSNDDIQDYAGYSFESAFFDPLLSGLISHVMYDLESDLRTKTFSKIRSKVMVRPEAIFELGIHHVSRSLTEDLKVHHVPNSMAFVHHYRKCVNEFDPLMSCQIFAHDESLSRYIPTIRHNIHHTLWQMKETAATELKQRILSPLTISDRKSMDLQ